MSALTGKALRDRLSSLADDPDRQLVVTPLLSREQIDDRTASIDFRLGTSFLSLDRAGTPAIDWNDERSRNSFSSLFARSYVPLGGSFVIHPGQFVLAATLEWLRMPTNLMAYVVTRSSWGRTGLIVATAVAVHPSFSGVVTLELRNLGEVPVLLRPGERILQLVFHEAEPPAEFGLGTYALSIEASPAAAREDAGLDRYVTANSRRSETASKVADETHSA